MWNSSRSIDAERVPLVRFVMFLGADPDTAEDVVQAAFTRAFPAWHTIRFPQAWLRKVAQSEYFGHCRAAARETSLDAAPGRADRPAGVQLRWPWNSRLKPGRSWPP